MALARAALSVLSVDAAIAGQARYWVACARLAEVEEKYADVIDIYKKATLANAQVGVGPRTCLVVTAR